MDPFQGPTVRSRAPDPERGRGRHRARCAHTHTMPRLGGAAGPATHSAGRSPRCGWSPASSPAQSRAPRACAPPSGGSWRVTRPSRRGPRARGALAQGRRRCPGTAGAGPCDCWCACPPLRGAPAPGFCDGWRWRPGCCDRGTRSRTPHGCEPRGPWSPSPSSRWVVGGSGAGPGPSGALVQHSASGSACGWHRCGCWCAPSCPLQTLCPGLLGKTGGGVRASCSRLAFETWSTRRSICV